MSSTTAAPSVLSPTSRSPSRDDDVDRAALFGPLGQAVEVFDHGFLERLANFHAVKAKCPDAAHCVTQPRRLDLEGHEPPIEALECERLLDQVLCRVASDRIGEQAAFFDERGAGHGS